MRSSSRRKSGAGPHVVTIGNHKGGCGKSTVAMHLIVSLLKDKRRVASFDLDLTQQTLTRYIENRSEWARLHDVPLEVPDHYTVAEPSVTAPHPDATEAAVFTSTLAALPAGYDFVVIDTPSGENHLSLLAHALADTLITPINDSFVDLDVIGTMAPSSDFKPRLWIDMIAHVVMGRDKRLYRFVQDTRYGRRVLGETPDVAEAASLVTTYVARRLVERERVLAGDTELAARDLLIDRVSRKRRRRRIIAVLVFGLLLGALAGAAGVFALAWWSIH